MTSIFCAVIYLGCRPTITDGVVNVVAAGAWYSVVRIIATTLRPSTCSSAISLYWCSSMTCIWLTTWKTAWTIQLWCSQCSWFNVSVPTSTDSLSALRRFALLHTVNDFINFTFTGSLCECLCVIQLKLANVNVCDVLNALYFVRGTSAIQLMHCHELLFIPDNHLMGQFIFCVRFAGFQMLAIFHCYTGCEVHGCFFKLGRIFMTVNCLCELML